MLKPGDKVRVKIDTHGGFHPYVGSCGYYTDTVRAVTNDQIVLTLVSWMPPEACTSTTNLDASVTVKGKTFTIRMLERSVGVWWAKLPGSLEPLATGATYDEALSRAVRSLHA